VPNPANSAVVGASGQIAEEATAGNVHALTQRHLQLSHGFRWTHSLRWTAVLVAIYIINLKFYYNYELLTDFQKSIHHHNETFSSKFAIVINDNLNRGQIPLR